jgi:pyruvate dehydrogenase E2 component (dihydrolipoamide acetyltransferase)
MRLGLDPAILNGSGPGGAVVLADVRRAGESRPQAKPQPPRRGLDIAEMRKAIATAMARSKREIPHYYLWTQVDLSAASAWLEERNRARLPEERLLMAALLQKATALALAEHRPLNGHVVDGIFKPAEAVHLGTAVATRGGGLIAPAIHHCDRLSLDDLMTRLRDLVARVRSSGLRSSELTDATATVSSLGERGVEALFGVIYPPQVALVGFGRVAEAVLPVKGAPAVRPAVTVTLAGDHRTSDGHKGALFLRTVGELLQEPARL